MLQSLFKQTLKPIQKAFSLHPRLYQDPDIFQKELKTIFQKSWIPIGYTNQFQTDKNIIISHIADKPIVITQDRDQKIRTFYNVCRHRGCQLVNKDKKANLMVCPYHCWSYKLDGSLMKTPQYKPTQEEFNKTDYNLFEIKTQILNNIILANPDGEAIESQQYYSGAFQDLEKYPLSDCKITHQKQYHVKCNWKLLIDNFIEYYHLPSVHPSLTRVSGVNEHQCTQKDGKYIGFVTDPLTNNDTPLDYDYLPPFPGIPKNNHQMAIFHAIYPNQFYFLFPHHIFSIILQPISPDYTIEHATLMGHSDITSKHMDKFEEIWKFYDKVNTEDLTICEQVQKGIKCDLYQGGKLVPKFEETIHRFHQMIIEDMKG